MDLTIKHRLPAAYSDASCLPRWFDVLLEQTSPTSTSAWQSTWPKIFKGAKPADRPIEQPMRLELVVNLKTAKQIGVIIPQWTLMKADRVIR